LSRRFDAIVIGTGLGGLTAGTLYARAGYRVLMLERNHSFGGAATVYRHGGLAIEASLHEIDGLDSDDPKYLASAFTVAGGFTGAILGGGCAARAAMKAGAEH
jgi:succinate dehydrogenase/fumarate reductase flavoprotein subunit